VIWLVFEKVAQSNARFKALDKLVMAVHSVKMPIGLGGEGNTTKGRTFEDMSHLKRCILEVKARENCLAHSLIISISRLTNDPNYKAYIQGNKIRPVVDRLLATTKGEGIPELLKFQEHFKEYRIVVFGGLNCDDIVFDGQVELGKRINLPYDSVSKHYRVINNLTVAMTRRYVWRGCNK